MIHRTIFCPLIFCPIAYLTKNCLTKNEQPEELKLRHSGKPHREHQLELDNPGARDVLQRDPFYFAQRDPAVRIFGGVWGRVRNGCHRYPVRVGSLAEGERVALGSIRWRLAVLIGLAAAVGLVLHATKAARETARSMACERNLRQIGIAVRDYWDAFGRYPPACTYDKSGQPMHSWRLLILPFMDATPTYNS